MSAAHYTALAVFRHEMRLKPKSHIALLLMDQLTINEPVPVLKEKLVDTVCSVDS